MQTKFRQITIPNEQKQEFLNLIEQIIRNFKAEGITDVWIEKLILRQEKLERLHTTLRRKPEDVTKELVIDPILRFLGYKKLGKSSGSADLLDRKEADYILEVNNERILVEAEPLNKELFNIKNQGVDQLKSYLERKSFRSDLGIATNGFEWVLIKFDTKAYNFKEVRHIDLKPFFSPLVGQQNLVNIDEVLRVFYVNFSREYILTASDEFSRFFEEAKEEITKRFYDDYIHYVFGYDTESKKNVRCLLTALDVPQGSDERDRRLFVITLMSRLIFTKFLEDKKLVHPNFLRNLLRVYRDNNIPSSFYKTYLQPLFYDVLNTPINSRKSKVLAIQQFNSLPYLNGGLFREVVINETQYDIDNDIIELVIETLEKYNFTLQDDPDSLNPDILGLVFEKTINYLTGEGNDRRRDLGAFYTPDDVTTYICRETIRKRMFDLIIEQLSKLGWKDNDIKQYQSLEDFLDNLPSNPKTLKLIYECVKEVTVLDPACGSGHFLTSAMKELLHLRRTLLLAFSKKASNYQIKREIITTNLFGVDIESTAVEIARLRLWLSLIEDLYMDMESYHIETLPNIEYNIEEGNSLLGFTSLPAAEQMNMDGLDQLSVKTVFNEIDKLKNDYRTNSDPKRAKEAKEAIEQQIAAFNKALNRRLIANLAVDQKVRLSMDEISKLNPFHWRLKFSDILANKGGFDVIIGNPPYIENRKLNYPTGHFITRDCGNTYAYFFELCTKIVHPRGRVSLIVPLSSICTNRMIPLQHLLLERYSELWISSYDNRPSHIFSGVENIRYCIIIGKLKIKNEESGKVYTTKYNRWYADERPQLFKNLRFVECSDLVTDGMIPKIGTKIEHDLLARMRNEPTLGQHFLASHSDIKIWYHNAPRYWVRAMNFIPKFEGKDTDISSHLIELSVKDNHTRDQIISILNSSLFYWFFVANSNCRDLTSREISNFNIDLHKMKASNRELLEKYCKELMQDLKRHSRMKYTTYKKTGKVAYQEFYPRYSKPIIDKIDDVLADHYGLREQQKKFVKSFDERFRIGEGEMATIPLPS